MKAWLHGFVEDAKDHDPLDAVVQGSGDIVEQVRSRPALPGRELDVEGADRVTELIAGS